MEKDNIITSIKTFWKARYWNFKIESISSACKTNRNITHKTNIVYVLQISEYEYWLTWLGNWGCGALWHENTLLYKFVPVGPYGYLPLQGWKGKGKFYRKLRNTNICARGRTYVCMHACMYVCMYVCTPSMVFPPCRKHFVAGWGGLCVSMNSKAMPAAA
jgi:hypothetical protein